MTTDYSVLLRQMSSDLGLLSSHLNSVIRTSPLRYKRFTIKKRDGTDRLVAQPAREVKAVQHWLVANLLHRLPIHDATSAYRHGSSIRKNAAAHVASDYMLKLDFQQFFPSIKKADIKRHLTKNLGDSIAPDALEMIAHCLSWAPGRKSALELCIGAPSSPILSNSIMFDLDQALSTYCRRHNVAYSRYADDLTFSCNERGVLDSVLAFVRMSLADLEYPRITLNEAKTVFASRRSLRFVTGIILTPDHKLSVGRERKRQVRSMYHRYLLGRLDTGEIQRLKGLVSFIESVEPGYRSRLEASVKIKRQ